jgi:hypothetical protein
MVNHVFPLADVMTCADTALGIVAETEHLDFAKCLLDAGADPLLSDGKGERPIDFAHGAMRELLLQYAPEDQKVVRKLNVAMVAAAPRRRRQIVRDSSSTGSGSSDDEGEAAQGRIDGAGAGAALQVTSHVRGASEIRGLRRMLLWKCERNSRLCVCVCVCVSVCVCMYWSFCFL